MTQVAQTVPNNPTAGEMRMDNFPQWRLKPQRWGTPGSVLI